MSSVDRDLVQELCLASIRMEGTPVPGDSGAEMAARTVDRLLEAALLAFRAEQLHAGWTLGYEAEEEALVRRLRTVLEAERRRDADPKDS